MMSRDSVVMTSQYDGSVIALLGSVPEMDSGKY